MSRTVGPLVRPASEPDGGGAIHRITPRGAGWTWTSFDVHRLTAGARVERPGDGREVLVLVLEGSAAVTVGGTEFGPVGTRASVFEEAPAGVVLCAPWEAVEVVAAGEVLLGIAAAPAGDIRRTALVEPGSILVETRGEGPSRRTIKNLLPPEAEAGRLIAVEAYTPGGNWSSYPPHKHDTDNPPVESQLEELYFYRFARPSGFAVQRVYTPDRSLDETMTAQDLDIILVPRGYHVVGAAAGYDTWYLNIMAGPTRVWRFTVDPDHAWLMNWDPRQPVDASGRPGAGEAR
ncbi:MAG TPA: 5-deoxy-glucuronate isomerase [Candidatus Limnocylindrales bacterium]|nr:5-deoxy-glucuronate isomerase [Candidatus Limnocylindrales bacterium]